MSIGLIDYGAGNLQSVKNALQTLGHTTKIIKNGDDLRGVHALIFPGVGAFGDSMQQLNAQGLSEHLRIWLRAGRPFLGICIGYQLLFESSEENPNIAGLGVFPGTVVKISDPALKVPHMGWNRVHWKNPTDPLYAGLKVDETGDPHFYFVHSYYPQPSDPDLVACETEYGTRFASGIRWPNGLAVQFHPEKSQDNGLKLIDNFARLALSGQLT